MKLRFVSILLLALALSLLAPSYVLAHGHIDVGDYEIVIGFHNEPAIQGEPNALDLFVTNVKTSEKVKQLEDTLQAELIFGSSKKVLQIEPQWEEEGAYTAYLIPTEAGDYTWHIFGTIDDTPVDISMTSSPDTFSSVLPKSEYSFPAVEKSTAELSAQLSSATRTAQIALILGALGILASIAGLGVAWMAVRSARH
jgi:hypothetical protein